MSSKLEDFKSYVKKNPSLRKNVLNGKRTWQDIFEDWVLFGEDMGEDEQENIYDYVDEKVIKQQESPISTVKENIEVEQSNKATITNEQSDSDLINSIMKVVKNVNPSTISQALNYAQKASTLIQSFSSMKGNTPPKSQSYYDPFFRKF